VAAGTTSPGQGQDKGVSIRPSSAESHQEGRR